MKKNVCVLLGVYIISLCKKTNLLTLFLLLLYSNLPAVLLERGLSELSSSHHKPVAQDV